MSDVTYQLGFPRIPTHPNISKTLKYSDNYRHTPPPYASNVVERMAEGLFMKGNKISKEPFASHFYMKEYG